MIIAKNSSKMIKDKISVVIPCYMQGDYLAETLDSVLAQTYRNWECVIVNDGSKDNTEDVANQYIRKDDRFKYVFQDNKGLGSARNAGILFSNGEFVLPLDSSDKIGREYMELAIERFKSYPETKLVYCRARYFGDVNKEWKLPEYSYETLLAANCIFCACIYRRSDYEKTGGYPTERNIFEDWDFLLNLIHEGDEVFQIDKVLFYYRKHGKSLLDSAQSNRHNMYRTIHNHHQELYSRYDTVELLSENYKLKKDLEREQNRLVVAFIFRKLQRHLRKHKKD